jgi:type I restriction enzyme S subunit
MGNEHWVECKLGDVIRIKNGYAFKTKDFKKTGDIPVIKQTQLAGEKVDLSNCVYVDKSFLKTQSDFVLVKGDVLMGMSGSLGKFSIYDLDKPALQNQRTGKLVPISLKHLNNKYYWYYLNTTERLLKEKGKGLGVNNISADDIEDLPFPLPPLNEQKRIVEKLDAVLPKVRQSRERLERISMILKKFRQSVLAAACSGRLTEEWREGKGMVNNFDKESISDFPYEIPENWIWIELDNISDGFQYGTSSKSEINGKVPVLRMGNLQNGRIDWSDLKYSNDKNDIAKYKLRKGDVLFNRTNSPDLVGKTSIFKGDQEAIFAGYLIRIKHKKQYLHSNYLNYSLNTVRAREWCKAVKSDGVSQSNINAQVLASFLVPLPPLSEQQEIVRQVETLFALADSLEEKYQSAISRVNKIELAVLAKAFRGELADADPGDEPAEELLGRILREKGSSE